MAERTIRRRLAVCLGVALVALAAAGLLAGPAAAKSGITSFSATESSTQAGGHPDVEFHMTMDNSVFTGGVITHPDSNPCNCDDPKFVTTHFPTGFIGDPHSVPQCTFAEFGTQNCPTDAQVGAINTIVGQSAIYNMEPHEGEAGLVGFNVPIIDGPAFISLSGRTGSDYGLDAASSEIFHLIPIQGLDIFLWGVPADPIHDVNRIPSPPPPGLSCYKPYPAPCPGSAPIPAGVPPAPYLENPTSCGEPLTASVDMVYYDNEAFHADSPWPSTTGCDQLSFNPSLTAQPTTTQADTATGLDVDLSVPQPQSPTTPSSSEIRDATVTLPEGFSINPNAADGKSACSDGQGAFGTVNAAACPESAKVGSVTLDSSALPAPIPGAIYLGQPQPGNKYRIFLTADGFGTHVKLAGSVHPDPGTGQIVVSFQELPQTPFQDFDMHFFGSERGLLATPTQCGTYPVHTVFVPWDSVLGNQTSTSNFTIDSGPNGGPCPGPQRPFNPSLQAGSASNIGGSHSPFSLTLTRDDGDQNLTALDVTTPPGFSATLKGIPYCPESAIATLNAAGYSGIAEQLVPACPAASQIGTATVGTGAGTHPLYSPGRIYLAGPYRGAPLSLEVVIPAVSGPYDLGNVAVRTALDVDPITAQVSAVSDPLPQILDGIPLRVRSILIDLDRPGFALNPTNCDPFSVAATVFGSQGGVASPTAHFQVANCDALGFGPKLSLRLTGPTKHNGHPGLHATLTAKPGDANIARTSVALPPQLLLDQSHIGSSCTRAQFAAQSCPANTVLGSAVATSPLLDNPLKGTVYLVSYGNKLPDVVAALRGQFSVDLHGVIDTVKGGLRTTFKTVPDVPVTSFSLDLAGGKAGLIANSLDICKTLSPAAVKMLGQNGEHADSNLAIKVPCGSARHKRHALRVHGRTAR